MITGGLSGTIVYTEEIRQKMSVAKLGKKQSPELIAARSAGLMGHTVSAISRTKISAALSGHKFGMTGRFHSEDTKKKMKIKRKEWWDAKRKKEVT